MKNYNSTKLNNMNKNNINKNMNKEKNIKNTEETKYMKKIFLKVLI